MDVTKTYHGSAQKTQKIHAAACTSSLASTINIVLTLCLVDEPSHQDAVKPILETLSIENMQGYLSELTAFNNRYYESSTGAEASQWIVDTIQSIIDENGSDATVKPFEHDFVESSVIATIPGSSGLFILVLLLFMCADLVYGRWTRYHHRCSYGFNQPQLARRRPCSWGRR